MAHDSSGNRYSHYNCKMTKECVHAYWAAVGMVDKNRDCLRSRLTIATRESHRLESDDAVGRYFVVGRERLTPSAGSSSGVVTAGIVTFHHRDPGERRKGGPQAVPKPDREVFARRVSQSIDIVQIAVIQSRMNRLPCGIHIGKVHHPAEFRIQRAAQRKLDAKRMAVQARTGVGVGQRRQTPRALQMIDPKNIHGVLSRKPALPAPGSG